MAKKPNKKHQAEINKLVRESITLFKAKKFHEGIKVSNKIIELDEDNPDAWNNLGLAKASLGLHLEAIEAFNQAISINPKSANTYLSRADAKSTLKRFQEAIQDYDKAIEINPKFSYSWSNRGHAKKMLGNLNGAHVDFNEAINLSSDNVFALIGRGDSFANMGNHKEAILDYDKVIQIDPKNANAWNNRALSKIELAQFHDALEDCNKAINLNPNYDVAWNTRGIIKTILNQHEESLNDFHEAIKINPKFAMAWNNIGNVHSVLDRSEEAIENYNKAIQLDPHNDGFMKNLLSVYQRQSIKKQADKNVEQLKDYSVSLKGLGTRERLVSKYLYVVIAIQIFILLLTIFLCIFYAIDNYTNIYCGSPCFFRELKLQETIPVFATITLLSIPQIWLIRIVSRIADESKILATDYERLYIMEIRTNVFASADSQKRQDALREQFINHMMTRSPVETLLKLRKRRFFKENKHPVEDFCSKCMELIKKDKGVS